MRKKASDELTIGALARRTGLSVSAVRFYEAKGLLTGRRSAGGQRRFRRADIRRLSFVRIAQELGLSLEAIAAEFLRLPEARTPTAADWQKIGTALRTALDVRIAALVRTREVLDGCIGCGCLSLTACRLYNPDDRAATKGAGPRYAMGDRPD